jgi:heptosyltransferase III
MTIQRFIEIWTYRYHKFSEIIISYLCWIFTIVRIKIFKILNPNKITICILLAEHFGDIVACEPITRELKSKYPNSKIYWIVKKPYRELLDYNPQIDEIIEEYSVLYSILLCKLNSFDYYHNCHLSDLRWDKNVRKYLQNPQADSLGILTNTYFDFGNILTSFAKIGNLPVLNEAPKLYIPKEIEVKTDTINLPKKFIALHCHSNYSPKDWQVYHWQKLVKDLLQSFDYQVVEIGLKSNLGLEIVGYHNLCGQFSLLETAEIIKRADYFIGIDSGPAHFANAVDTFGFLLFGKLINFENYMPYSGKYQSLENAKFIVSQGEPCSELPYEIVWKEISETIQHHKNLMKTHS